MKVIENNRKDNEIIIRINTVDDLWYLKNLLGNDDLILVTVFRRTEQNDDLNRSKTTERKKIKVKIKIDKIDFQPYTDKLRISGEIVEGENTGSHQSALIGIDDEIKIIKFLDNQDMKLIDEAENNYYGNNVFFISMDDENAIICNLKSYGIQDIGTVYSGKSGKYFDSGYNDSSYLNELVKSIKNIKNATTVIIIGPGFEHSKLYNKFKLDPYFNKIGVYDIATTENGKRGIYEFLDNPKSEEIIKNSRLARDEKIISEFLKGLNKENLSIYGYGDIKKYAESNMIRDLLISEEKFRSPETKYLLDILSGSASVHIISKFTESGEIIKNLGGFGAILRFAIQN